MVCPHTHTHGSGPADIQEGVSACAVFACTHLRSRGGGAEGRRGAAWVGAVITHGFGWDWPRPVAVGRGHEDGSIQMAARGRGVVVLGGRVGRGAFGPARAHEAGSDGAPRLAR